MKLTRSQIPLVFGVLAAGLVWAQPDASTSSKLPVDFGDYWNAELALTYTFWDSLGDLDPAGSGGPFETEGVGFDTSIKGSIGRFGSSIVFLGFNFGMAGFDSNVFLEGFPEGSALDLTYAAATLNFRFGDPGQHYVDIDIGFGAYYASNLYIDCVAVPECFSSETNVTKPGGFIGASWAIWRGLKLSGRVHYADFGTIGSIGPESGTLAGPMYTAQLGWEFGNWFSK